MGGCCSSADVAQSNMERLESEAGAATVADISGQKLTQAHVSRLSSVLASNLNLASLTLNWCELTDNHVTQLCDGLVGNVALTSLVLTGNRLGDAGALEVSKVIDRTCIQLCNLSANRICRDGFKALVGAAERSDSLTDLRLGGNKISLATETEVEDVLGPVAGRVTNLAFLDLRDNFIADGLLAKVRSQLRLGEGYTGPAVLSRPPIANPQRGTPPASPSGTIPALDEPPSRLPPDTIGTDGVQIRLTPRREGDDHEYSETHLSSRGASPQYSPSNMEATTGISADDSVWGADTVRQVEGSVVAGPEGSPPTGSPHVVPHPLKNPEDVAQSVQSGQSVQSESEAGGGGSAAPVEMDGEAPFGTTGKEQIVSPLTIDKPESEMATPAGDRNLSLLDVEDSRHVLRLPSTTMHISFATTEPEGGVHDTDNPRPRFVDPAMLEADVDAILGPRLMSGGEDTMDDLLQNTTDSRIESPLGLPGREDAIHSAPSGSPHSSSPATDKERGDDVKADAYEDGEQEEEVVAEAEEDQAEPSPQGGAGGGGGAPGGAVAPGRGTPDSGEVPAPEGGSDNAYESGEVG